jgi:hypothetical protein
MQIYIDIETDRLYLRGKSRAFKQEFAKGFEQGVQKERRASVINLVEMALNHRGFQTYLIYLLSMLKVLLLNFKKNIIS